MWFSQKKKKRYNTSFHLFRRDLRSVLKNDYETFLKGLKKHFKEY